MSNNKVSFKPSLNVIDKLLMKDHDNQISLSRRLKGVLMCLQDEKSVLGDVVVPDDVWEGVLEEYKLALTSLLQEKKHEPEIYRSYEHFMAFIAAIQQEYPHEEVLFFSVDPSSYQKTPYFSVGSSENDYPLLFDKKAKFISRMRYLFGGRIPSPIWKKIKRLPEKNSHIYLHRNYTIFPKNKGGWGVECVFEIKYTIPNKNDEFTDIPYTFPEMGKAYTFLMKHSNQQSKIEDILICKVDEFDDEDDDEFDYEDDHDH